MQKCGGSNKGGMSLTALDASMYSPLGDTCEEYFKLDVRPDPGACVKFTKKTGGGELECCYESLVRTERVRIKVY